MSHQIRSTKRLTARSVAVSCLSVDLVDDAFALFAQSYTGVDRARFERDLREKQRIILLHDPATGQLKGFSTVLVQHLHHPRAATVIFSGDTVIDREYWGQKQLQIAFARMLLIEKLRAPMRPLYWFLISKGYRTYMLLANAFPRAVPRHDAPDDAELRTVLDRLAQARFGAAYDPTRGIVRADGHERVRDGLAPVTQRHLGNPHVRFFVTRNPGHTAGDELACLATVRLVDLARIAIRIIAAIIRLRLPRRQSAAAGLPQAEGA